VRLACSTIGPDGRRFGPSSQTENFVGSLHYPSGYATAVDGGTVSSCSDANVLRVKPCPGATQVTVTVGQPGGVAGGSCC